MKRVSVGWQNERIPLGENKATSGDRIVETGAHRRAVAQLWGSFGVRAVGALAQRLGQLPLLHGRADALLSGSVAAVQP